MPTYEYECKSCSHNFEIFQAMSDPPLKECPKCGQEVRRLILGGSGVIFKGTGFYATDKGKSSGTVKSEAKNPETKTESTNTPPPCAECPKKGVSASCPA
ncbi:MAG: zinc ribbon domain-containing protein [Treponema sp.]|nr:zinc ribbon domain-containing protein [Treponema sp.]